ncbi:MAG: hypothetical protein ACTSWZ_07700 [Candidatus Heimdallarchaeaceae archaeon]
MFVRGNKIVITDEDIKPKIPKELHWLLQLKELVKRGYLLKFCYWANGKLEECDKLKYFETDSEGQSYIPVKPDIVKVYEYKRGEGFVLVRELRDNFSRIDPDVKTAMKIWDLVNSIS